MLSQISTCLSPEAIQAILDGAILGASQRAEWEDPAMIEGDQRRKRKYESLLAKF